VKSAPPAARPTIADLDTYTGNGSSGRRVVGWRKAHASTNGGNCVEVALSEGAFLVRDSKDPDGPILRYTPAEWAAFLNGAKAGEFDPESFAQ
jgi:hypothetical protein